MILHTILQRPYVVAFLCAYLIVSSSSRGVLKTLIFLFSGYLIAWASEALSIRTGFPYGWYFYVYENLQGEWLNQGVPVWDSVSYVFLCYAGMELAKFCHSPLPFFTHEDMTHDTRDERVALVGRPPARTVRSTGGRNQRQDPFVRGWVFHAILAALFVTFLDLIIDPLANMGDQWFLGRVYYYPEPGFYFGVPLSNFLGWFFVSFLIVATNVGLDFVLPRATLRQGSGQASRERRATGAGPLLYFGIFLFNWIITLSIGQWRLALLDLLWMTLPIGLSLKALAKIRHRFISKNPPSLEGRGLGGG